MLFSFLSIAFLVQIKFAISNPTLHSKKSHGKRVNNKFMFTFFVRTMRIPFLSTFPRALACKLGFLSLFFLTQVVASAQGQLWGMTSNGGSNNLGVIFRTNADGSGSLEMMVWSLPFRL